jgi:Reverse transcriptase (RNA-dependent DNA polymerase)
MDRGDHTRLEAMPTPGGRIRMIARLAAEDGVRYDAAVAPMVSLIERAVGPSVLANRARPVRRCGCVVLRPWRPARSRLLRMAVARTARARAAAVADVRACYPSVPDAAIEASLTAFGARRRDVRAVLQVLDDLHRAGIPGLPVGPAASAVLANGALAGADEVLADAGVAHLRWVDDMVLFARGPRAEVVVASALGRLDDELARIGLTLAHEKTRALEGAADLARTLRAERLSPCGSRL